MTIKPGAALLFDIDGTLVHSDPLHLLAFNQVLQPHGESFDHARFASELQGMANVAIGARLLSGLSITEREAVLNQKEQAFRDLAAAGVDPLPGLLDLLAWADEAGVPVVAVTNAPRANAELLLGGIGLIERFSRLVIGEELAHGKPHPLPYLEGLRLTGGDPANSVAFEDSRTGIASATAAGIATVGMMTGLTAPQLLEAGASLAAPDYADPSLLAFVRERLLA